MMKAFIFALAMLLTFPVIGNATRKRAFMVGISSYKKHYYKTWNSIHGKQDIDLLSPVLEKHGFTITSVLEEKATYNGILSSLDKFITSLQKGDIVYLHFSCHGQPVEDGLKDSTFDEKDGWDESIVPIDAGKEYGVNGYKGEKHITDDELNTYIERLRKQIDSKGMLYVVMDACHAGEMSREGLETVRGTNEALTKSLTKYNPPRSNIRHFQLENGKGMAPTMFFEACKSRERNTEVRDSNGKEYGALSYNVFHALNQMNSFGKKDSLKFKEQIEQSTKQPRRWPKTQTLVIESSY